LPVATCDLVTSRHSVAAHWDEIARVLAPGGTYLSQQVGADSPRGLRLLLGPQPLGRSSRRPELVQAQAEQAGLEVTGLRTAELRVEFFDVGAVA
jgi:SAM-dependent methyltransferase